MNQPDQLIKLLYFISKDYDYLLQQNEFQQLLNSNKTYDLFITLGLLAEHMFKFAYTFDVPLIQVCLSVPLLWTHIQSNNHNNLGYDVSLLSSEESFDFISRFTKLINQLYVWFHYEWIYLPRVDNITEKYFSPSVPTVKEVAHTKTEGLLVNSLTSMGYNRPYAQNVLEIGGLHCKPPQKLSFDLEKYISDAGEHGVIYFSIGTTVSDLILSLKTKTSILNVFKKLPQRILWKLDKNIENLPENVMIRKWFPQQDILGHNKTRLFITQGGMLSMQEAAYHKVQVLVLPMFMDQLTNGRISQRMGYGKVIKLKEFNKNIFHKYILELINNPKYKKNVKIISEAMKDKLVSREDQLKEWVNFIIKHKSSSLKPMIHHLSYIELLELDLYFTLFVIIILLLIFSFYLTSKLFVFFKRIIYITKIKVKKS